MRGPKPPPIVLTPTQRVVLGQLARRQTGAQPLVRRARIILEAASGANNEQIAKLLGIDRGTVRTWRMRWLEALERLKAAEKVGDDDDDDDDDERVLGGLVEEVLVDEPRSGKPATFTPEQICRIVALACEDPREESGRPITHWTTAELADEAIERGIVQSISARSVGRFLGRGGFEAPQDALLAKQRALS